ncbi:hypothetical protein SAQ01S_09720 [Sphingomonas aquatilis NBRC 16722]|nr:hypothetical protein SAQ01S_09720 [Sphingomonas aquatilis NBRC 16722]
MRDGAVSWGMTGGRASMPRAPAMRGPDIAVPRASPWLNGTVIRHVPDYLYENQS